MSPRFLLGAGLLFSPLLSVAAPDRPLDIQYDWGSRDGEPVQYTDACPVQVGYPSDDRINKETIGASASAPLLSGDLSKWLADGLANLKHFGYSLGDLKSQMPPQGTVAIKASLGRVYTWHVGLKIFSMVALKVEFIDANGSVQVKRYRARGDKTNMVGAEAEYVTALNYALNNLLPTMASDLALLCKGSGIDAYSYSEPSSP